MAVIKIGFSTSNAPLSRAIRLVTRSKVSHTFLIVEGSFLGQAMVMEAASSGFRLITYDLFQKNNTVVTVVEPPVSLEDAVRRAASWLGERYAYEGLVGFLVVLVGRALKRQWHNPIRPPRALFCSEANTFILQAAGWPGASALDPYATDPEDLEEFVTKSVGMVSATEKPA